MRWIGITPLLVLVAVVRAGEPVLPHLQRARQVLAEIKDTVYQHKTEIDEKAGSYKCDCSGLVSFVLRKELPKHYKAVSIPGAGSHPRARRFCDYFDAAPVQPKEGDLWQKVERVAEIRPGDIIAWKHPRPLEPGQSTGHVVIADTVAKAAGDNIYAVTIIDSTTAPHKDDTRKKGETGVGRGTIFLKVDAAGRPVGHASRSGKGKFVEEPMAIGRVVVKGE